jgi:hypothetical protein
MVLQFILSIIISLVINISVLAQVDTEFWFVAPEVTALHADRPIFIRIASFQKPATITISQTATQSIAANSAISIDMTNQIDEIENKPNSALKIWNPYTIK